MPASCCTESTADILVEKNACWYKVCLQRFNNSRLDRQMRILENKSVDGDKR